VKEFPQVALVGKCKINASILPQLNKEIFEFNLKSSMEFQSNLSPFCYVFLTTHKLSAKNLKI